MYVDTRTLFAEKKALAAGAFGDVVDLAKAGLDQGAGSPPVYLVIVAHTAVANATINLVASASADLASETILLSSGLVTAAAGSIVFSSALPSSEKYNRYLGLKVAGAGTGTVTAFLTSDAPARRIYKAEPA